MPRKSTPRLSAALDQFLTARAVHLAENTMVNDRSVLGRFVAGVGDRPVHLLDPLTVERYFAGLAGTLQASSYNKVRSRVQGFLAFCTRRGWSVTDPLSEVHPRRVIGKDRLRLDAPNLLDLLDATDSRRDRALLAMALNTGLRACDLVALRVAAVDLAGGWVAVCARKTGRVDRLPVTADLDREMRTWLSWRADQGLLSPSDYLFCSVDPVGHLRPDRPMSKPADVVKAALGSAGFADLKGEGMHTIRRSVARIVFDQACEQGEDQALRITAALLGHSSTAVTERYLGLDRDRARRDDLLRGRSFLVPVQSSNVVPLRQSLTN